MNSSLKKKLVALYVIFVLLAFGAAFFKLWPDISWPTSFHWDGFVLLIIFQIVFWLYGGLLWKVTLRYCGGTEVGFKDSLVQTALMNAGKYIPGKVWGVAARTVHLTDSVKGSQGVWRATLYEQVAAVHAGVLVGLICLFGWMGIAVAVLTILLAGTFLPLTFKLLTKLLGKEEDVGTDGLLDRGYTLTCSGTIVQWILGGIVYYCLAWWIFGPFGEGFVIQITGSNALGGVAGFLALFAPGGLGVREAATGALLQNYLTVPNIVLLVAWYRIWVLASDFIWATLIGLKAGYQER